MNNIQILEYIWIDGYSPGKPRSKTKVSNKIYENVKDLPLWNYDGSSTNQASGHDSEIILKPRQWYYDPFRRNPNSALVICDTYTPSGEPCETNTRIIAEKIFEQKKELEPRFGIEQEFFLSKNGTPLAFNGVILRKQGHYYCGTGADNTTGRKCIEEAFQNCLYAGLNLTGLNSEVAPSQWEFQVDAYGIEVADQLYIMRYIIDRTAEEYGWNIDLRPKPIEINIRGEEDWNGSGCHTNFSTKPMREPDGYMIIMDAINKLSHNHEECMKNYGISNDKRMTGKCETADYNKFSFGVANRGASIRIPRETESNKCGYFEDRRPGANMDPYVVTSLIYKTCCLN